MKKTFLTVLAVLMLTGCGSLEDQSLYSWYDSESAAYNYTKRLSEEDLAEAMAQYKMVIEKQKGSRATVPPGANAEYGYMLYKAGKHEEGLALLKAEMDLYPESKVFVSRVVKQLEKK